MLRYCSERAEDVAAASAAYLLNILPGIVASDPSEGFRRLSIHIQTVILAYVGENVGFCVPEPSEN